MTGVPSHSARTISIVDLRTMVGQEIAKSEWIAVTQQLIRAFADVTGDRQWIHLDSERAKRESAYGTTIAHGFLTLSLLSQMFQSAIRIADAKSTINYGLNRVRFPSAVPANSRIRASFTVQSFKQLPEVVEITFLAVIECENAKKPCCVAEWILRYYS
jgi:acyl dehydratase